MKQQLTREEKEVFLCLHGWEIWRPNKGKTKNRSGDLFEHKNYIGETGHFMCFLLNDAYAVQTKPNLKSTLKIIEKQNKLEIEIEISTLCEKINKITSEMDDQYSLPDFESSNKKKIYRSMNKLQKLLDNGFYICHNTNVSEKIFGKLSNYLHTTYLDYLD